MDDEQNGKQPSPATEEKKTIPQVKAEKKDATPVAPVTVVADQPIPPIKGNEESMEVHTHGHVHEKKKWKEYLFQFLMLFLAVFCGFLAENYREHYVEHLREKQFINSLVEDVKSDTAKLAQLIAKSDGQVIMLDSLVTGIGDGTVAVSSRQAYRQWSKSSNFSDFIQNDRTIQQLKSSGSLRLIRNKAVSDSIMRYDQAVKSLAIHQQVLNTYLSNQTFWFKVFDFIGLRTSKEQAIPLTEFGKNNLSEAYADRLFWQGGLMILVQHFRSVDEDGKRLIAFINSEYHLR